MNHTLCILSYNRPVFLRQCIETAIRHADQPLEIIVHDDGSVDNEVYLLLEDFQKAGKISLLMLSPPGWNQGQGIALNRMFNAAQSDVIWKVDQDLLFQPGWLRDAETILVPNEEKSALGDEPRIGLLGSFHYWNDPCDSRKTMIEQYTGWSSRTHILGSCFAVTRECWNAIGPFEERSDAFAEDWVFQNAVTESRDFVCALPEKDFVHNQGFGPGPSTVVAYDENHQVVVSKIKKETYRVVSP